MLLKTTTGLPQIIQEEGCLYFSLLWIAEQITGKVLTVSEIIENFSICISKKSIDNQCTVLDPNSVLSSVGVKAKIILTTIDGKLTNRFPTTYQPKEGQWIIQEWHNSNTGWSHFVNGTPPKVDYDSLGYSKDGKPISKTRREGKLVSLRVYQVAA